MSSREDDEPSWIDPPRMFVPAVDLADPVGFPKREDFRIEKERMAAEIEAVSFMEAGLRALHEEKLLPPGFLIDLAAPPYQVPCPTCHAFALEPCRNERRTEPVMTAIGLIPGPWPASSRMVRDAHAARHRQWTDRPEMRVVPIAGTYAG